MQSQTLKQEALASLQHLPDNADIDEIMYRLYIVDKIRKSREAVERGDTLTHEALKREIDQW
jgi:predicted lipase